MNNQISPQLFSILYNQDFFIGGDKAKLKSFHNIKESILELGEIEHTGDWDPYLRINFTNGETLETDNGYHYFETQDDNILLEDAPNQGSETNGDDSYLIIPIKDIKSIRLLR